MGAPSSINLSRSSQVLAVLYDSPCWNAVRLHDLLNGQKLWCTHAKNLKNIYIFFYIHGEPAFYNLPYCYCYYWCLCVLTVSLFLLVEPIYSAISECQLLYPGPEDTDSEEEEEEEEEMEEEEKEEMEEEKEKEEEEEEEDSG